MGARNFAPGRGAGQRQWRNADTMAGDILTHLADSRIGGGGEQRKLFQIRELNGRSGGIRTHDPLTPSLKY